MKNKIFKITAFILLFAGGFCSCEEEELITIEDLYAQPLSVIQECVQGKWKWYVSYGGFVGINYPKNTFVDIRNDHYIYTDDRVRDTTYFTWEKYTLPDNKTTWVMWDKELDQGTLAFMGIKNDTLYVTNATDNEFFYTRFGTVFIRVK